MKKETMINLLRHFSRILAGLLFLYSGFVKGIDPLGSAYKFNDYFEAFGLSFMMPISLSLSFFLSAAEFLLGAALITGLRMRVFAWLSLLFMSFFTILTFYLAIKNPVSDCGCFGDAIILTNWQTFYKNLIINIFVGFVFFQREHYKRLWSSILEYIMLAIIFVSFILFSWYNYNHLPLIDYRPYKVGTHIPSAMLVPEGAAVDVYKTIFYYKNLKTGEVKEFNDKNYPWQDTLNWSFSSYESKLVSKGFEPTIHDFSLKTNSGIDTTEQILAAQGYTFFLVSYELDVANYNALVKADEFAIAAAKKGLGFYCLTSATAESIEAFKIKSNVHYSFLSTDKIPLKTIVRSNPGLVLIKGGTILANWHYNDIPSTKFLDGDIMSELMNSSRERSETYFFWFIVATCFLTLSISGTVLSKICFKKKNK